MIYLSHRVRSRLFERTGRRAIGVEVVIEGPLYGGPERRGFGLAITRGDRGRLERPSSLVESQVFARSHSQWDKAYEIPDGLAPRSIASVYRPLAAMLSLNDMRDAVSAWTGENERRQALYSAASAVWSDAQEALKALAGEWGMEFLNGRGLAEPEAPMPVPAVEIIHSSRWGAWA